MPAHVSSTNRPSAFARVSPARLTLFGFALLIGVGTLLLMLPWAHATPQAARWIDALFMSTSAVCVTGLVTLDTATDYTLLGQGFLIVLMELGGIGYVTMMTLVAMLIGRRISLRDRLTIQAIADLPGISGIGDFIRRVVLITLWAELLGFLLLLPVFIPVYGWWPGLWYTLFHTVASFTNSGFVAIPGGIERFRVDVWFNVVTMGLVVLGGLGYLVIAELWRRWVRRERATSRFNLLVRIVLWTTLAFTLFGTVAIWLLEFSSGSALGELPLGEELLTSLFLAINSRSGGLATVDVGLTSSATQFLLILLMFIGAGPGSMAGGIKITTFVVLVAIAVSALRGSSVEILGHRPDAAAQRKAVAVFLLSFSMVALVAFLLSVVETRYDFIGLLFETVSAFGTTGLSTGIVPKLTDTGKLLIILTMVFGRIGVLAIGVSVLPQRPSSRIKRVEESLIVG